MLMSPLVRRLLKSGPGKDREREQAGTYQHSMTLLIDLPMHISAINNRAIRVPFFHVCNKHFLTCRERERERRYTSHIRDHANGMRNEKLLFSCFPWKRFGSAEDMMPASSSTEYCALRSFLFITENVGIINVSTCLLVQPLLHSVSASQGRTGSKQSVYQRCYVVTCMPTASGRQRVTAMKVPRKKQFFHVLQLIQLRLSRCDSS